MKLEIDRFSIRLKKSIKYDAWDQDKKYTSIWSGIFFFLVIFILIEILEHEIDNANGSKEIILLPRHASNFLMKFTLDLCERIHKMFLFDVDEVRAYWNIIISKLTISHRICCLLLLTNSGMRLRLF